MRRRAGRPRRIGVDRKPSGAPRSSAKSEERRRDHKRRLAKKASVTHDERLSAEFPLSIMLGHGLLADPVPMGMSGRDADDWKAEQKIKAARRHEAGMRLAALYGRLFGRTTARNVDLGYTTPDATDDTDVSKSVNDMPPLSEAAARVKALATYEALRESVMAEGKRTGIENMLGFLMRYAVTLERDWYINDVIADVATAPRHSARARHVRIGLDALMHASVPSVHDDDDAASVVELRRRRRIEAVSHGPGERRAA